MNLNKELFRRTAPSRKLELIENATSAELSAVKAETIIRCVQEVGEPAHWRKEPKKRVTDKKLRCERVSNGWDASFYHVAIYGREHILTFYFEGIIDNQYIDLDGFSHDLTFKEMTSTQRIKKEVQYEGRDNHPHWETFCWDWDERMECFRSILRTYVKIKYKDKLL